MRVGTEYLPKDSIFPLVGLNTLQPSTQANPSSSPDCLNIAIQKGIISKRKGYTYLGGTLNASGAAETVLAVIEFESLAGVKFLLAFTTRKQYKWDGSAWQNITGSAGNDDYMDGERRQTRSTLLRCQVSTAAERILSGSLPLTAKMHHAIGMVLREHSSRTSRLVLRTSKPVVR
jgi:hypothetical protein